jgi:hypothetical protein
VRRILLEWFGEGERADAERFWPEGDVEGMAWDIACWYTPFRGRRAESFAAGIAAGTAGSGARCDVEGSACAGEGVSAAPLAASENSQSVKVGSTRPRQRRHIFQEFSEIVPKSVPITD